MNQTIDSTVKQTAYHGKSGGFFSWSTLILLLAGLNVVLIFSEPSAPYASFIAEETDCCTPREVSFVAPEERTSLDRAMGTLEEMKYQRAAMKKFTAAKDATLSARDVIELESTMKQAGFSEAYIADFVAKKKAEIRMLERDDTAQFAKSIAKDIVKEEVDSFAYRLELVARVGGFIWRKVQGSSEY